MESGHDFFRQTDCNLLTAVMKDCLILLAEDDPDDRSLMQDAFKELGFEQVLSLAENGQEVIPLLEKKLSEGKKASLVVLDLNMPKLNGTQTLERMKTDDRFKDIPVIIYSTALNPWNHEKCLKLGAHNYLIKSNTFDGIVEAAKSFLAYSET